MLVGVDSSRSAARRPPSMMFLFLPESAVAHVHARSG
jgi:hypothetical protein